MSNYTEGFDLGIPSGWASDGEWLDTDGYAMPGCVKLLNGTGQGVGYADINETIELSDYIYFACRPFQGEATAGFDLVAISIEIDNSTVVSDSFATTPIDFEWVVYSIDLSAYVGSVITDISITTNASFPETYILIDDVTVDITPPTPPEAGATIDLTRSGGGIPGAILL